MLKILAIAAGFIFIAIGILGFLPQFTPHEKLLGIFSVNLAHNLIHLLSGVLALICGFSSKKASRSYFVLFGLTYGAIAALGFYHGDEMLLGMIANNQAASWLHLGITILFLIIGFFL
jgi:hypothetical protein